ncbi:DNA-directed RNA polymerase subunit beta [Bacillus shivajii]|uniref:DNA-directed RNA polymerase subunit beta n=1 Tax=Bacillus shivajii TaxID=1983719 RepID=UPI001CFBDB51|nr:DNA-directed RNA polymerase subunit beta [Bacillus shivajii]UCZ53000.1 DNA-directed RNA polymerase subunit beta [Bacillus shivajii]
MNKDNGNEINREEASSHKTTENSHELKDKQSDRKEITDGSQSDISNDETSVFSLGDKQKSISKKTDHHLTDTHVSDKKQPHDQLEKINPIPPNDELVTKEEDRRSEINEDESMDKQVKTRKQLKKEKANEESNHKMKKKRGRIRLIPLWIRVIVLLLLLAGSLVVGTMFGYGIVGEGEPSDIFERDTWYHIYDIIYQETELERTEEE